MSCALGRAQSPMALRFWLPKRSTCDAIIMMWRRPDHTTSNTRRYGIHASSTSSARAEDSDGVLAMSAASPSVSTRSGAKVSRARRAPICGTVPKGLAITSPSPRQAWAHATAHTSARVTSRLRSRGPHRADHDVLTGPHHRVLTMCAPGPITESSRRAHRVLVHRGAVAGLVDLEVTRPSKAAQASGSAAAAAYAFWKGSSRS